jgi:DedD protein
MWSVTLEPGRLSYLVRGKLYVKGQTYIVSDASEARYLAANSAFIVKDIPVEREKVPARPEPKPQAKEQPRPEPQPTILPPQPAAPTIAEPETWPQPKAEEKKVVAKVHHPKVAEKPEPKKSSKHKR